MTTTTADEPFIPLRDNDFACYACGWAHPEGSPFCQVATNTPRPVPVRYYAAQVATREDEDGRTLMSLDLTAAVEVRRLLDAVVANRVAEARAAGESWRRIGEVLGTSPQAAQQRYGA